MLKVLEGQDGYLMRSVFNVLHYLHYPPKVVVVFPQGLNLF
jgi:hypothetical protein